VRLATRFGVCRGPLVQPSRDSRPLVVHIVYRFDVGGLENGVVNLINHMPGEQFRHAIVALTDASSSFAQRLNVDREVVIEALNKPAGHGVQVYRSLHRLLKQWRPSIVHTRNLAALEMAPVARAAGVPVCVHGEHGRDADDPHGLVRKYQWMRRVYRPFVDHHVALSGDLKQYLHDRVGVSRARSTQIINGVDTMRFMPRHEAQPLGDLRRALGCPFADEDEFLVGTVGRMQTVKNQPLLAQAFVTALQSRPALRRSLRLVMVGDGPLRAQVEQVLRDGQAIDLTWLPGERNDVPQLMRAMNAFALPSSAEGISNTILEAMATGLPVVATRVGGNDELIDAGVTGELVRSQDAHAMAAVLTQWCDDRMRAAAMGAAGRQRTVDAFSLVRMVQAYADLYDSLLRRRGERGLGRMARARMRSSPGRTTG
jgi:sugar transferase (PEP-CTERM/EpsH1 system associated)